MSSHLLTVVQPTMTQVAAQRYDSKGYFHLVYAQNGMLASEQELAIQVGISILKQGSNAIDAVVAVSLALAVVLPNAGNIGGGDFMMLHDAKSSKNITVGFREVVPMKAVSNMYLDEQGNCSK